MDQEQAGAGPSGSGGQGASELPDQPLSWVIDVTGEGYGQEDVQEMEEQDNTDVPDVELNENNNVVGNGYEIPAPKRIGSWITD